MNFLETIHTEIVDFQEQIKQKFVRDLNLIIIVISLLLGFYHLSAGTNFYPYFFLVVAINTCCLIYWKKNNFKYYKQLVNLEFLIVCCIITVSIFSIEDYLHFQEALWLVMIVLCAFFVLGKSWGTFYLFINIVIYTVYFQSNFWEGIQIKKATHPVIMQIWTVEMIVAILMIAYVMILYRKINLYGVERTYNTLERIEGEKKIIEKHDREKASLLKEIHHRVKDNLQVIVSLLQMQSNEMESKTVQNGFQIAINRIRAMALTHQRTYQGESKANANIKEYIKGLVRGIIADLAQQSKIEPQLSIQIHAVEADKLVYLGLIINELISNSVKHAFINHTNQPNIKLKLWRDEKEVINLLYSDNGQWKVPNKKASFGLQIIEMFTEQLDGTVKRTINQEGTLYLFKLPAV